VSKPRNPPPVFYKLNPGQATICQRRKQIAQRGLILGDPQRSTLSCGKKSSISKEMSSIYRAIVEN